MLRRRVNAFWIGLMDSPRPESEGISMMMPISTNNINTLTPTMAGAPPGSDNEMLGSLNEVAPRDADLLADTVDVSPELSGSWETTSAFRG